MGKNKKEIRKWTQLKYGIWNIGSGDPARQRELCAAGYSPLTAAVLCSRGYDTPAAARAYLATDCPLHDPMALADMDKAVARVNRALENRERIAVFGDYDVDGITATCLLTDFLRSRGGDVTPYIPARIEEGYGLNEIAIAALQKDGIGLIITVDCGITADREAALCRSLGIDLVITDHHECKDALPDAVAVVNPHRKDCAYPHTLLAGVGVAFKLAAAVAGDQEAVLSRYCDLVCLGTVADVMPLQGENRTIVCMGLTKLTKKPSVGIRALMGECGSENQPVTASLIGYTLAPRINAAGRMGQVDVALELFLTGSAERAAELAAQLCKMNRHRQSVELEIYKDATTRLAHEDPEPEVIVLAGEAWHQGVVGIVASRLAEEFRCPTFLICMDGDKGKASSRSYGGFNLFGALETLSPLLESYGGHELAAGFTIHRENIDAFQKEITRLARSFRLSGSCRTDLEIDCETAPDLLTIKNVDALDELEPSGAGCPRPVFYMSRVRVDSLTAVGGGKHMRLRLCKNDRSFAGIFFSTTAMSAGVAEGDLIDIAFQPQINEFRGCRSVQLNLVDLRQDAVTRQRQEQDDDTYDRLQKQLPLERALRQEAIPRRQEFVALWKYLTVTAEDGCLRDSCDCLAKKVARTAGMPWSLLRTRICLDVFRELGLLELQQQGRLLEITLRSAGAKVDLDSSRILAALRREGAED